MAANIYHLSAGLPVAKDSGQSPSSGVNTFYLSAGLPPEPISAPPAIQYNISKVNSIPILSIGKINTRALSGISKIMGVNIQIT